MKIKEYRKLKNISCQKLADIIGVSLQAMQRYENCKAEPSIETLIKLAKFFGISVDKLIGNDSETIDLKPLDDNRKYLVNKIVKELDDVTVGKLIGYLDK